MTKLERITKKIESSKDFSKSIEKVSYYSVEQFINDAMRYINAIKDERMINSIGSVSSSGMSRTIKFLSCEKKNGSSGFMYLNYFAFFQSLGYSCAGKYNDYFRVNGCGMDMIFHTNYTNIHKLQRLGFITRKQCDKLAQLTPTTI